MEEVSMIASMVVTEVMVMDTTHGLTAVRSLWLTISVIVLGLAVLTVQEELAQEAVATITIAL